jgi:hypothetical protein
MHQLHYFLNQLNQNIYYAMAEIRVEPKQRAPIWPWIVGIVILLGLIWLLVEAFERDDPEERREDRIEQRDDAPADRTDDVGSTYQLDDQPQALHLIITAAADKRTA